jgi:hypothetical protein
MLRFKEVSDPSGQAVQQVKELNGWRSRSGELTATAALSRRTGGPVDAALNIGDGGLSGAEEADEADALGNVANIFDVDALIAVVRRDVVILLDAVDLAALGALVPVKLPVELLEGLAL